ncbi:MAG: transposase [Chlorobi bacterium]|nr:transposase [Chlorobiota bacterium]
MFFEENKIYHIYNTGNQYQKIFFSHENYLFFIQKIRKYLMPVSDILAWCLMPNHFHIMIAANDRTIKQAEKRKQEASQFSENLRLLLSQYSQAINKQENLSGSLFRQNTKSKCLYQVNTNKYAVTCFHYIHRNPFEAKLVSKVSDWQFSSFKDHAGLRTGSLCNINLAQEIINYDKDNLEYQTLYKPDDNELRHIW